MHIAAAERVIFRLPAADAAVITVERGPPPGCGRKPTTRTGSPDGGQTQVWWIR
jgi:hypothetical protein